MPNSRSFEEFEDEDPEDEEFEDGDGGKDYEEFLSLNRDYRIWGSGSELQRDRLQDIHCGHFEKFRDIDKARGDAKRLGFPSARQAWEANPIVQHSDDGKYYKAVEPTDEELVGEKVRRILVGQLGFKDEEFIEKFCGSAIVFLQDDKDGEFKPEASFSDIMGALRKAFGVEIPDEKAKELRTVQHAISYIEFHARPSTWGGIRAPGKDKPLCKERESSGGGILGAIGEGILTLTKWVVVAAAVVMLIAVFQWLAVLILGPVLVGIGNRRKD